MLGGSGTREKPRLPGEEHFRALLDLIRDPQKYAARLDELVGREQSAKDAIEKAKGILPAAETKLVEANALKDELETEKRDLADKRAAFAARVENANAAEAKAAAELTAKRQELTAREAAVKAREDAISGKENDLKALKAQTEQTLSEAQALRATWQKKLDAFESIR